MSIKVTAIQRGYFGLLLREPGKPSGKFVIEDESEFSKKWMIKGHPELTQDELARLGRDGKRLTQTQLTEATKGARAATVAVGGRASDKSPI